MGIMAGDYVSYMDLGTKEKRRAIWKRLNFAGTTDRSVGLQSFTADDMNSGLDRPQSGEGCVAGRDDTVNTGDLCEYSCALGFCPESLCTCTDTGSLEDLPPERPEVNIIAWDEHDVDLNRLCKFACKYGFCPDDACTTPSNDSDELDDRYDPNSDNYYRTAANRENMKRCHIFKDPELRQASMNQCRETCREEFQEAVQENRTTNYGCVGFFPLNQPIPWGRADGVGGVEIVPGTCFCDNWIVNEFADSFIEAIPMIGQVCLRISISQKRYLADHDRLVAMS
jgi:hypothetical protein